MAHFTSGAHFGLPSPTTRRNIVWHWSNLVAIRYSPGNATHCYKTGTVRFRRVIWSRVIGGTCPGGAPVTGKTFEVMVAVRTRLARIYLDGSLLTTVEPYHEPRGRVGVFAFTGRGNKVFFRRPELRTATLSFGKCVLCLFYYNEAPCLVSLKLVLIWRCCKNCPVANRPRCTG